jgi:hypothetical protein
MRTIMPFAYAVAMTFRRSIVFVIAGGILVCVVAGGVSGGVSFGARSCHGLAPSVASLSHSFRLVSFAARRDC